MPVYDIEDTCIREEAPEREAISAIDDLSVLHDMASDAADACIAIETQLQWLDEGDYSLKRRRVAALIYWKMAQKNIKNRISQITAERNRLAKAA